MTRNEQTRAAHQGFVRVSAHAGWAISPGQRLRRGLAAGARGIGLLLVWTAAVAWLPTAAPGLADVLLPGGARARCDEARARPALRRGAQARLRYLGRYEDRVSAGKAVRPDGRPDGHFRLYLATARPRKIVHVLLRSCDSRGVLTTRAAWDTDQKRLWVLGLFRGGKALPMGGSKVIDRIAGRARYDLFASAPVGGFRPHESYCAYVTFDDGMGVWARERIGMPVRSALRWVGTDRDRVGRGKRDKPDGVPDGHFILSLDPAKQTVHLTGLRLERLDAKGHAVVAARWDTRRNAIWVLGVERGGRRLNWGDRPIRERLAGPRRTDLHLYAAAKGPFRPGQRYRVVAWFDRAGPAVAVVKIRPQVPAQATLTYLGMTADRLGAQSPSPPDGKPDPHFRLTIRSPTPRRIANVVLRAVWPGGAPVPNQVWDTRPRGYRMIAAYRKGRRLNPMDGGISPTIRGAASLDLFIHNTGWVRPGQTFQVEVVFRGGNRVFAKARVPKQILRPLALALAYRGFTADRVGRGARGGADGQRDAQFVLSVDTGGRTLEVTKLELSVSDARGRTWRKTWDTQPGGAWILGVERAGRRLNPTDRPVRDRIRGRVAYTLWVANDFWRDAAGRPHSYFVRGGYFTARIYAKGHPVVIRTVRIR